MPLSDPADMSYSSTGDSASLTIPPEAFLIKTFRRTREIEQYYRLRSVWHLRDPYTGTPRIPVDLHPEHSFRILSDIAKRTGNFMHDAPLEQRKRANSCTNTPYQPYLSSEERDEHNSMANEGYSSQASSPRHLQEGKEKTKVTVKHNPTKHDISVAGVIDPLSSNGVILDKVAKLDTASYLNAYALYMTMSFGAVSGAALFSWEQSVETVDMAPIIPITLFWTTILCTLGLPLSLLSVDEIKDLQAAARECSDISRLDKYEGSGAMNSTNDDHVGISTEKSGRRERSSGGEPRPDLEEPKLNKVRCKCMRCMSKARRYGIYSVIFLPPIFTAIAFVMSMITMIALMFTTEEHKTAVIATAFCVPAAVAFLVALFWLLYRRFRRVGEA